MNFCKLLNSTYAKIGASSSDLLRWWRRLAAHTPRVVDIYIYTLYKLQADGSLVEKMYELKCQIISPLL